MTGKQGSQNVTVLLECAHVLEFSISPPMIGDEVWCQRCRDMREVFASEDHWSARCNQCSFGQDHGLDEGGARVAAVKHARKRGHAVRVRNGRATVSVVGAQHDALFTLDSTRE